MNLCVFSGNLGSDPEVRYTNGGSAVATVNMAVNERWRDKDGQQQERTEWIPLVIWGALAEAVGQHLRKGSKVLVRRGRWQTRSWDDQESGQKRYKTECVVQDLEFLDTRQGGQGGGQGGGQRQDQGGQGDPPAGGAAPPPDDDLPF